MKPKSMVCLWLDGDVHEAACFCAATFPDSRVVAMHHAPSDYPNAKEGDIMIVEFTVLGIPCIGLNGGATFRHNEAFSFQVATGDQAETDRYWDAIVGNGGQESQCGWCKDRWGISARGGHLGPGAEAAAHRPRHPHPDPRQTAAGLGPGHRRQAVVHPAGSVFRWQWTCAFRPFP